MSIAFFIAYFGFVALFFFLYLPTIYRMSGKFILRRNPSWLKDHPDVVARITSRHLPMQISYLVGIIFFAFLASAAFGTHPLTALTGVYLSASTFIAIATLVEVLSIYRYYRAIPPPDSRETNLNPKGLGDYISMPILRVAVAILTVGLAFYVYAYLVELIPAGVAVGRIVGIFGIFFLSGIWYIIEFRRPSFHSPASEDKKIACYMFVFAICLAVLVLFWRIANDFFSAFLFDDAYVFFGSSIILTFIPFLYLLSDDLRKLVAQK